MRWLITNRSLIKDDTGVVTGFGTEQDELTYWTLRKAGLPPTDLTSWEQQASLEAFKSLLVQTASRFPDPLQTQSPAGQKHLCLFVHGYNVDWSSCMRTYDTVATQLFDGDDGLGELISFDWPSKGSLLGYLPDRSEARQTGDDLVTVLSELYDWMLNKQQEAAADPVDACRARTSLIAHSMGNYVLEYAMNALWTRKNRPLLVSLLLEVLMVAADVDNDLFSAGESVQHGDGEGLANLSYRITALYTGRDDVLGASAGLKHFGKRRLGRAGLDRSCAVPDNVWDIDCSTILAADVGGIAIHGEYFNPPAQKCYKLMRAILQGVDRSILIQQGLVQPALARVQPLK